MGIPSHGLPFNYIEAKRLIDKLIDCKTEGLRKGVELDRKKKRKEERHLEYKKEI
jgi:hypothetical protein